MHNLNLRKLGKVLLVDADKGSEIYNELLQSEGTAVDVVEHKFVALIRLGDPRHGYNFAFLGSQPQYPDAAKRQLLDNLDLLAE